MIQEIDTPVIVIGTGASMVAPDATLVYVDMARWEIQQRFRRHEVKALGIDNRNDAVSLQYKEDILMTGVYAIVIKILYSVRWIFGWILILQGNLK